MNHKELHSLVPGLLIAGTDTDVGKTTVAVAIVRSLVAGGLRVGVYKPVATGISSDLLSDASALLSASKRKEVLERVCPQSFGAPLSPQRAAEAEGKQIDETLLRSGINVWRTSSDVVIVEGAGGLFSPLAKNTLVSDLARDFGYAIVLVDRDRLGSVGRTLGMIIAARSVGLDVAAVILSRVDESLDQSTSTNATDLAQRLGSIPIAVLEYGKIREHPLLDWQEIAQCNPSFMK